MPEPLRPLPDAFSTVYWDAARDGRLLIQRCTRCSRHQLYPRQHCAACLAADPEWITAAGRGTLHSYTVVHRTPNAQFAELTPYVLALVDLDEGVRITTALVDIDGSSELRCGARVRIVFTRIDDDVVLPCATLDACTR